MPLSLLAFNKDNNITNDIVNRNIFFIVDLGVGVFGIEPLSVAIEYQILLIEFLALKSWISMSISRILRDIFSSILNANDGSS